MTKGSPPGVKNNLSQRHTIKEIFEDKELIKHLVVHDLKVRYKRSNFLGALGTVAHIDLVYCRSTC